MIRSAVIMDVIRLAVINALMKDVNYLSSELENIILTIDTREQNQKRIKAVEDWALGHGAIVEHSALKLCDYLLLGEFRGVPVNLGIEAKSLSDFCSCGYEDLKEKLFNSFELFDEVALFIETGNYTYKFVEGIAVIDNPAVRDGSANVFPLAVLEGCCSTLPAYGIHVRQLRSEAQFPDSIWNLLTYTTTPQHIMVKTKEYPKRYKQVLLRFLTPLQVKKVMVSYPNFHWLASASEESLKIVLGSKTGQAVNDFLHCHELETDEWRNNYMLDGQSREYPDNFLNRSQDDEGRLAFDVPAKNSVNASGTNELACRGCENEFDCIPTDYAICQGDGYSAKKETPVKPFIHIDEVKNPPKKCAFADSKKQAECKTPDHFKQHSKTSSHAEGTILSNHNIPHLSSADTSSHSGIISKTTPTPKPDDPRNLPPQNGAVKQVTKVSNFPLVPAETHEDIGLDDKPLKCIVKCRACSQVIEPSQDDDSGFCQDVECIAERKKPVHAKNLIDSLKLYLKEPHTVPEIVREFGVTSGYAFGSCMGGVKAGWLKKVTEQTGKTTFERII